MGEEYFLLYEFLGGTWLAAECSGLLDEVDIESHPLFFLCGFMATILVSYPFIFGCENATRITGPL